MIPNIKALYEQYTMLTVCNVNPFTASYISYLIYHTLEVVCRGCDTHLQVGCSHLIKLRRSNFLQFITHIKSSSSNTSRELRQQFAACSG